MNDNTSMNSQDISLQSLLEGVDYSELKAGLGRSISDVCIGHVVSDSREVQLGALFVAIKGVGCDGHDFVLSAFANGCAAVICEKGRLNSSQLKACQGVVLEVEDSARAYGIVAANYYGNPAAQLTFVGITGTNGKTTVTYLLEHVLRLAGAKVGVIGTVNNRYVGDSSEQVVLATRFTTPEAMALQSILRQMADGGVDYVIMEVSSHALLQNRIGEICFKVAAFTNLSRDHLDYHPTMDEYFSAKLLLFSKHIERGGVAVLPSKPAVKDELNWHDTLLKTCTENCAKLFFWGNGADDDIRLLDYDSGLNETSLSLAVAGDRIECCSPLVGRFNIDNMLTVFGLGLALGLELQQIITGLKEASGAPGRFERVVDSSGNSYNGAVVLVDYAHTPDALEQVLSTLTLLPHGELYCLFGCGGDRDTGKRPLMGAIGCRFADVVIVTDDNPRTEDPDGIVRQILAGTTDSGLDLRSVKWLKTRNCGDKGIIVERDRKKAIRLAISAAGPQDIVLIAGKGHETYQLGIQGHQFFDDRLEAKDVLASWTDERLVKSVNGKVASPGSLKNRLLGQVSTDSREVGDGSVFVALKGENHDAHDFAAQAAQNGALCLIVEREIKLNKATADVTQIIVPDTLKALGDMAAYRRGQFAKLCDQAVVAITGSCGKTTVKEMVAAILQRKWPQGVDYQPGCVLKTRGNFNNLIGLPLSLLPLKLNHRVAVLEMGMNQAGELSRLTEIVNPDISCIVNIHGAHLEGLHSIEGVARAKEELFAGTGADGILVVNLDDKRVSDIAAKYGQTKVTFAVLAENLQEKPDFWVSEVVIGEPGVITFTLHNGDDVEEIHLYAVGEHNVSNSVAAAAIAYSAGAGMMEIAAGLADFRAPDKRMQIVQARAGYSMLNDTYNANPASMAVALKTLNQLAGKDKNSVAILGDMLELGDTSKEAHFELGQLVSRLNITSVGLVGNFKEEIRKGAIAGGMASEKISLFAEKNEVAGWLDELVAKKILGQGDILLVKASRGLRFETIVAEVAAR